ncbi:disease resistance protein RPV1 [Cryptomeria japonica]|uniref:disease resistance protein RPV1 n=1 Tax=Cryptomeria japonica TaxID=3369 RepID=UPI0027D9D489|nr:disease resistance protein RPV1 [Cryptomeria japonica]
MNMMNSDEENAFQGIAPALLSSKSADYPSYDVFINHRGPDVKKTLAEAIYRHLSAFNLRVFLDQKELRTGDFLPAAIQHALATCKIHIAIFSPGYAESPWCLAELSFMLKTRAEVIPVFYDVQPSQARYIQTGPYAKAFEDYHRKKRIDLHIVEKWKEDLHTASFFSGLVHDTSKDEEHILLKSIVNRVVVEAKGEVLEVAKHPVGLEEAFQAFQNTILEWDEEQGSRVKVVGIVGMGGSGKTTLAKKIYNEKSWTYKGRCCFLSDVRLESTKNGLASLQRKLLQKLVQYDWQIENSSQGKEFLRSRLQNEEVLIVLDDVDDEEQFEGLLVKEVLGRGSLVIVTSRDKSVLTSCGISLFHEVKGMAETHAKQLFCWHAFLLPDPLPGFESLVQRFLVACSGLPLSLKVIGSLLYKKKTDYWNGTLEKIGKHILPSNIINTLKISYEALDREEREIFLDVAWFFSGEEINTLVNIWEGSEWSSLQCLENLEQKCLVEFIRENRGYKEKGEDRLLIRMHDHLRDMGRSVIDDQSPPSRLWRPIDIRNYLYRLQLGPIMEVRGICTSPAPNVYESGRIAAPISPWKACWMQILEICGVSSVFRGCSVDVVGSALRLLAAHGESVIELSDFSRELLWLRWYYRSYTGIPSSFSMQKLRVLEVLEKDSGDGKSLWQSDEQAPTQLRELSVQRLSKLPESVGLLKHLKKLVLSEGAMRSLPDEICHLKSLYHLDLNRCWLEALPNQFGNLTNLRHLDLSHCSGLQALPDSFSQLIQLQYLCLFGCFNLMLSTDILRNIRTLHYLDLEGVRVDSLPTHITSQTFLTNLYVSSSNLKNLPTDIGELGNLRVLQVHSRALTSLPSSLLNLSLLRSLNLLNCVELNCLPESIGELKNLKHLSLIETRVRILPQGFVRLINLVEFSIHASPLVELILCSLRSAGHTMSRLKSIKLSHSGVVSLSISKEMCPNLETLQAAFCDDLVEVKGLPITLVDIDLHGCPSLKKISGLSNLTKLKYLNMRGCLELQELDGLSQSTSLELLITDGCCMLTKMDGLKHLSQLKDIQIAACQTGIWPGIECLKRLPPKICSITLNMKIVGGDETEVDSILSSFKFPVSVLEFSSRWVCKLGLEEVRSCSALIMLLFCKSSEDSCDPKREVIWLGNRFCMVQYQIAVKIESQCEWIIINLFTRESAFIEDLKIIKVEDDMGVYAHAPFEKKKGWVVFLREGEEWKITEIWDRLFTYAYSKRPFMCGAEGVM